MIEQEPWKHQPATMEQTASRFQSRILEGLEAAQVEGRDIDPLTARMIAPVLGRAQGRESALADFGRTGEGSNRTLLMESLSLYAHDETPPTIKEWINWPADYLTHQEESTDDPDQ